MRKHTTWRVTQQLIGIVIIAVSAAKFIDNIGLPPGEFLYRIRMGSVDRWQEQIALLLIIAATASAMVWFGRDTRFRG